MRMTQEKEQTIAASSRRPTLSLLKRKPRMVDQRGFVWKMMVMKVIGINVRLNVKRTKLVVAKNDLAYV